MDWLTVSLVVPITLGVIVIATYAYDAFRGPRQIQALRMAQAVIVFYFVLLYIMVLRGQGLNYYLIVSGITTRIGVTLLFVTLLIEGVVRRRYKWKG